MARTLVGQLILRLRSEGLGEANKIISTLNDVEKAARRMGAGGVRSWGVGFQKQIDALKLSAKEMKEVERSWLALHDSFKQRNLAGVFKGAEVSHWKTQTISTLAQTRAAIDRHFKAVEARASGHAGRMRDILKIGLVSMGAYTAPYFGGMLVGQGLRAASEERRVMAEAKFAGLSPEERGKIDTRANDLSGRYRLEKSRVYEIMKEASLSMPSTDSALSVSEEMARAYVVLSNFIGPEGALSGLRNFNKAMDNIEKVTPEEYRFGLENYMKAQQVVGRDMDPEAFAQAIKYARTGGKVFGDDFLFKWLPMIIAESGGSDAGTQLRAGFDQFIVGRASKQALNKQKALGIRGEDGKLIGQDAFTQNPITWVYDYLLPALQKKGVDTKDETELARVVGELTNNRLSSDLVMRALLSFEQYRRLVEERLPNAAGLDAADEVQKLNPFAAWEGFKASLENLSAALLPMDQISAGLNGLADGINAIAAAARDNPLLVAGLMGGGGLAAYGGGKIVAGKLADIFGLKASALALDGSAAALTRAAIALGGAGVAEGAVPDGKKSGGAGLLGLLGKASPWLAMALLSGDTVKADAKYQPTDADIDEWTRIKGYDRPQGGPRGRGRIDSGMAARNASLDAFLDTTSLDAAAAKAQQTGQQIESALNVTATPQVNTSTIDTALAKARELLAILRQVGPAAAQAAATIGAKSGSIGPEMRRNLAD